MAYKVYYGYIEPVTVFGYTDCYKWTTRTLIHDTSNPDDENYLIDPILKMNANEAGSFEADVPKSNICWNDFSLMLGMIEVEEDGDILWQGRITQINIDFNLNKHIYCEGELSFLNDCAIEVDWGQYKGVSLVGEAWGYHPIDYFIDLIQCDINDEGKRIRNGTTDRLSTLTGNDASLELDGGSIVESSSNDVSLTADDTVYKNAWEGWSSDLLNGLLNKFNGYVFIVLNREHNSHGYRRVIDLMVVAPDEYRSTYGDLLFGRGLDETTSQTIEFDKNLIDIDVERGIQDDIRTLVYAYGYQTKGWWIFKHTDSFLITQDDPELRSKYGRIEKYVSVDGVGSTAESLNEAAASALSQKDACEYQTIKLKAIDLYDAGEASDHLRFMKFTNIISEPHGINRKMLCTGCTIPLDKPDQKEFVYGSTVKRITASQTVYNSVGEKSYEISRTLKQYITES